MRSALLVAGLAVAACGGNGSSGGPPPPVTLEMDTWWATPSELAPIQSVVQIHEKQFTNVTVKVVTATSQAAMDTAVTNRFAAGNPPAALQANLGANGTQFASGALDLSSSAWNTPTLFNKDVLATLTANNKLIGVPLGLTRQNVTYWNMRIMKTLPAPLNAIPQGAAAFQTWLAGVAAAGYTHPLCFGFKDGWVNAHILFEDIVPAMAGADYSKTYWSGADPNGASSAQMSAALDFAAKYVFPYLTSDTPTMGMAEGIDRVMNANTSACTTCAQTMPANQCIMTAMGDWGGAQLDDTTGDKYVAGPTGDFDASGWPGAETIVDFGGDAMVAAAGKGDAADVTNLFDTFASEQGQLAFATLKGEIPARNLTAADQMKLPYLIQKNIAAQTSGTALPGFKVIANGNYDMNSLYTAAQNFFLSGDKTALLTFLAQNYSNLK
jgi:ABC-type glycerol-3-phosphate transport system substrate-binding protein